MTGKEVFKTLAAISKTNFGCLNEFNDLRLLKIIFRVSFWLVQNQNLCLNR